MTRDLRPQNLHDGRDDAADVAVIGMAGRFPGARDLEQFWENIAKGVESAAVLTAADLAAAGVPASIRDAPGYVPVSSRLDDADCFDAALFGYSPREAALMDPQSRVCLELAWHALEDAGYSPLEHSGSIGVFASASLSTYLLQNLGGRLDAQDFILGLGNIPIVLGNGPDFIATRVSYKLDLRGPSVAVQTACSSALTAIHLARQCLLNGECDVALAGGVSIYLPQDRGYLYQDGMILSPDGHCRAFDADANGILFGRGGGIVVLKPLAQALEDGDRIRAVITGSAMNNDGARKAGYTAPSPTGQSRVIAEALADAGVRADSISYIEAHGTGTTLGDPIEIAGLTEAFRKHTARTGCCALGTVKANIGHLDVAAGVTGFIKTVLMLEHGQLPPSLHFRRPNPAIDFAASPFYVNTTLKPWDAAGVRRAGVSAFGIGGTNVHMVLEEAPARRDRPQPGPAPMHVMRVTARTGETLAALSESYAHHLGAADGPDIADVCFTANTGRAHLAHRAVVRAGSISDLRDGLAAASRDEHDPRVVRGQRQAADAPPVAFLFTGLGAQQVGMGLTLFETQPVFRAALERCDVLLRDHLDRPLLRVLYPEPGESSPIDEATYGQPVMFSFEYALSMLWQSWGVRPAAVLGHSLGEYAGSCLAGLLPLEEALRLVAARARLADTLPAGGGMAAAFAGEQQVRDAIGVDASVVSIASINGPESIVMSGRSDALARVAARLAERQVEVRILNVAQAFHSGWLDPILDQYEREVAKTRFGRAEIPIISNVTGGVLSHSDGHDPHYWRRHAREVVRFAEGVRTLYDRGIRHFLEMGPHTTATAMAAGCVTDDSAVFLPSLRRGRDDWDQILESLSELYVRGVDVDWVGVHAAAAHRRVPLPLYPFERTRHWIEPAAAVAPSASDRSALAQPMLRRIVESPLISDLAYELSVDSATHPFLDDHRIFGGVVFPATGYVEAAVEAVEARTGRRATVVEDLEITEPLTSDDGGASLAQAILKSDGDGFDFALFSRGEDPTLAWRRHGGGRVSAAESSAHGGSDRVECDAIRARCTRRLPSEEFYSELAGRGFGYGPLFRGVESVWLGEGEILGEVRLPAGLERTVGAYRFHPALLDSCLQIVLGLAPTGKAFLPVRVGRFQLGELPPRLLAHAAVRPAPAASKTLHGDVRIANEGGDVVAEVSGIVLQEADARRWAAGRPREWERWLYEPTWRAAPLARDTSSAEDKILRRRWLVVDDGSGPAARLVKRGEAAHVSAAIATVDALERNPAGTLDAAGGGEPLDAVILFAEGSSETTGTTTLLSLTQALVAHPTASSARLWVVTRGAQAVTPADEVPGVFAASMWGLANVILLEHPELRCSCIDIDAADDSADDALWDELEEDSAESKVAVRGGVRYVARLVRATSDEADAVPVPGALRRLASSEPGLLDALRYVDAARRQPGRGEVEIAVHAAGLNFKDVLVALGRFPDPAAGLGHECAGEVVAVGAAVTEFAVGDAVIAFAPGSLATHVIADALLVAHKPAALSFEQAATIAGGFLTAHHSLHTLAKIGAGDSVLVHAATGGVGLAAVQIAQRAGATVFATAGSDAKRAALSKLGVAHVFSSRDTGFAGQIEQLTEGRGVSVVLNSLTGDVLEASVRALGVGGRFVELGLGSELSAGARARLGEGSYFNPNVAQECLNEPLRFGRVLRDIVAAVERGELSPLPHRTFDAADTVLAFRLMARAGHIGKVVIRQGVGEPTQRITSDATYLIVGGLGGLGLLVAERLVERGARHLALMGRRPPGAAEEATLGRLVEQGVQVLVLSGDVANPGDVARVMARMASECPPLRGVIHAAGVLDDGVLVQQTRDRFVRVMAPKVAGGWNLHEATAGLDLDFFIQFSSIASLLGSQGQGNHAAANAFLDALASHRRARGLPALSINWGAWADVGAAARRKIGQQIAGRGWGEITPDAGLAVLEHVLGWSRPQVGVLPIDWQVYRQQFGDGQEPRFLSELMLAHPSATASPSEAAVAAARFADRVRGAAPGERHALVARLVREQVVKALGLDASRPIDGDVPLAAMGLDSLLAVALRNALNRELGLSKRLSATLLFDYPSINALTGHLHDTILEGPPAAAPAPAARAAASGISEADIASLTDEEAEALLLEELE